MNKESILKVLSSFFLLFKAEIETVEFSQKSVTGAVKWNDEEESQNFVWYIKDEIDLEKLDSVIAYLIENSLVDGDKVNIPENQLLARLVDSGWTQAKAQQAIDDLCDFEIKMLDDDEESDSFFIHF